MNADELFTTTDVSTDSLIPERKELEIKRIGRDDEMDTISLIYDDYRTLVVKKMMFMTDSKLDFVRRRLLDILREYSRHLDISCPVYECVMYYTPLSTNEVQYYIYLNPCGNVRQMLNLLVTLDDYEHHSNDVRIFTASDLGAPYGHYDSEITPRGELIDYLKELKYNELPVVSEDYDFSIREMQMIAESCVCSLFESYGNDRETVLTEVRKWLRASRKHWSLGRIEEQRSGYKEYEERTRLEFSHRAEIYEACNYQAFRRQ